MNGNFWNHKPQPRNRMHRKTTEKCNRRTSSFDDRGKSRNDEYV